MLKDLRLENLAKMLKDKYITLLHNIIVQSHFMLTMMVVGEGNKESGGQRRRKYRGGGRSGTGSKINPTSLGAHLLQPVSPSCFLMMPMMIMTIIMVMIVTIILVMVTLLSIINS